MTMRFVPTTRITDATNALIKIIYAWLDFMRTASPSGPGWSVVRSSNGTNYTDDGVGGLPDNIASWDDLNVYATGRSWFVLRSPDLGGGTYKELLWYRLNTTNYDWACRTTRPSYTYSGGNAFDIPTATTSSLLFQMDSGIGVNATCILHMGADDAAPFGFWIWAHNVGVFGTPHCSFALLPITAGVQPNDDDPYVFLMAEGSGTPFARDNLCTETNSVYTVGSSGRLGSNNTIRTIPGMYYRNVSNIIAPSSGGAYGLPANEADAFLGFPIPFGVAAASTAPTGFKGWTDFALWNSDATYIDGKTYDSGNWIAWSSLLLPWDGSLPEVS